MKTIAIPFGWLMLKLYELTGSYGIAVILFAVVVNLILLPFMMKSKASMMRTTRLQPKITELQKRHEGNQQKLQEEMGKLYREEHVSPMSGCIWSIIPFPILIALYYAIRMPVTIMMGVSESLMAQGGAIYQKLAELGYALSNYSTGSNTSYEQIYQAKFITEHFADFAPLSDKLIPMNYHFLGIDLSTMPNYKIWEFDWSSTAAWLPALGLFAIPLISAFMSWLSMQISNKMNPQMAGSAQQQSTTKTMTLFMPLISIWIGFVMPAALGIYWIINSVLGVIRDFVLTKIYTRKMDKEDAVRLERNKIRDMELERKRLETEKLRAENATAQNRNTSKKKLQAGQKQKDDERRAAAEKAERAARRERLGITESEKPASQVGSRRFAKGRAYVEDRYINPESAGEATAAAAEASESVGSIDPDVQDDVIVSAGREAEDDFIPGEDETSSDGFQSDDADDYDDAPDDGQQE